MKEVAVEAGEAVAEPRAADEADSDADCRDEENHFDVVTSDRQRPVAERLQEPDLLALQRDHARQRDVDEKGRYQQEDRRHHASQRIELPQFRVEKRVRQLVLPAERAGAAILGQEVVEPLDDFGPRGTG